MARRIKEKKRAGTVRVSIAHGITSPLYSLVIISAVGLVIYLNSFNCSLHFDDLQNIMSNRAIRDLNEIKGLWDFSFHSKLRIIGFLTFALNYHFHGLHVFGYHVVNMAIHLGASWCVWWLVMLILSSPGMASTAISKHKHIAALGCALLFVSHPLQTQAVTYIVQRFASLAALFYLASLCLYLRARMTARKSVSLMLFGGSIAAGLLGMFTKEIVFTLPFAVILFELIFIRAGSLKELLKKKSTLIFLVLPLFFLLIIPAIIWSGWSIPKLFWPVESDRYSDPLLISSTYLFTQFRVLPAYIGLLFFPLRQNLDHDFPASHGFFEFYTAAGFLFLLALFITAIVILPKRKLEAVGILWFFLTLSVESTIIPLRNVMFEHRLYLPMFGFSLFLVSTLYDLLWEKHARAAIIIFLAIITGCSFLTYERNKVWKTDLSLWTDTVRKSPNKARPHNNLGNALLREEKTREAIAEYKKSLEANPGYVLALNNLGNALSLEKDYDQALEYYAKALSINPGDSEVYMNMGTTFYQEGRYEEALKAFQAVITINPASAKAHVGIGDVLYQEDKYDEALKEYRRALEFEQGDCELYNKIGSALFRLERFDEAFREYERARNINPRFTKTYNNMGIIFYRQGKYAEAVDSYRKALGIDPGYTVANINCGDALMKLGRFDEAVAVYRQALSSEPDNIKVLINMGDALYGMGNVQDAIAAYLKTLNINSNNPAVHYKLGFAYRKLGTLDKAADHTRRALELEPSFSEARQLMNVILREQGNTRR
ncbi:tetratricopeptide repeat protein [bacterium]|nr:tetratricopeptide repeat protein [bacterium]